MTETDRRIACVFAALDYLREEKLIPATAAIRPEGMAYVSRVIGQPVSKSTFQRRVELARLAARASRANHSYPHPPPCKTP